MAKTSNARIANDSPFCEAHVAMDKIIERLLAMADEGATADEVSRLIAKDGNALLRELTQGYFDRRAELERRVEVVGADGVERREARTASRRIETVVGEIEVNRLLQAPARDRVHHRHLAARRCYLRRCRTTSRTRCRGGALQDRAVSGEEDPQAGQFTLGGQRMNGPLPSAPIDPRSPSFVLDRR